MQNSFYKVSFLLNALAVVLGAFGAHVLRNVIDEKTLQVYNTGVLYHFLHAFALLFTAWYTGVNRQIWVKRAGWLFIAGILLFSGSLYAMSFFKAAGIQHVNWLGAVTPLGGICFIAGWLSLFLAISKVVKN